MLGESMMEKKITGELLKLNQDYMLNKQF